METRKRRSEQQDDGGIDKGFDATSVAIQPSAYAYDLDLQNDNADQSNDERERGAWDSPIEFLLSCISMSVGLGNIWRFPFTAYENGGGAFIIPYLIVLIFIGRPIYFLEMSLGQFAGYGPVKIWRAAPFFKGIGYVTLLACIAILSYYCTIIATTIYYLVVSFQSTLPWDTCHSNWANCTNCIVSDCSKLYYNLEVIQQKENIDDGLGMPIWHLTLCLLAAWVLIFLSLVKGVKSSGKVAYFTAIFPYVVLVIFLIRGLTLEGSMTGIKYFIEPQWDKIYLPEVWYAAIGQCFFSLGAGQGPIGMLSSYNPFRHTAYRDALIISLMDTITSLLAGFTIFAVLGNLSHLTGVPIDKVTDGGPGLVFVAYPSAISKFPGAPQVFSVLFFLMLFTLGIGSANALAGVPITILSDQFKQFKKWHITLCACVIGFLSGLIFVTPGGQFMVTLVDYYGGNFILYFICMMEATAIAWVYGLGNFITDLEFMLGIRVGWYWKLCWGFITPVGLFAVLIYTFATAEALQHEGKDFPTIATAAGWILAAFSVLLLPLWSIHAVYKTKGMDFMDKLKNSLKPKLSWGPRSSQIRGLWIRFKDQVKILHQIPTSENNEKMLVKVRGEKERILIRQSEQSVVIRILDLSGTAEVDFHNSNLDATRLQRIAKIVFRRNQLRWRIHEDKFEVFRVTVESKREVFPIIEKSAGEYKIKINY